MTISIPPSWLIKAVFIATLIVHWLVTLNIMSKLPEKYKFKFWLVNIVWVFIWSYLI